MVNFDFEGECRVILIKIVMDKNMFVWLLIWEYILGNNLIMLSLKSFFVLV